MQVAQEEPGNQPRVRVMGLGVPVELQEGTLSRVHGPLCHCEHCSILLGVCELTPLPLTQPTTQMVSARSLVRHNCPLQGWAHRSAPDTMRAPLVTQVGTKTAKLSKCWKPTPLHVCACVPVGLCVPVCASVPVVHKAVPGHRSSTFMSSAGQLGGSPGDTDAVAPPLFGGPGS